MTSRTLPKPPRLLFLPITETEEENQRTKRKMFFFFAGGVEQQVRQVLKSGAGRCIVCRSPADLVDYEKVLKLFFFPVWRWPGKEPQMHCNNCKLFFPQHYALPPPREELLRCRVCDRRVEAEFSFCPYCGSSMID